MRTLKPLDRLLLVVLVPLWLVLLWLHLGLVLADRVAWLPIHVAPAATQDGFPVVSDRWTPAGANTEEVSVGDILRSVEGRSLAGASRLGVFEMLYAAPRRDGLIRVDVRRDGIDTIATLPTQPLRFRWRTVALAVGLGLTGIAALLRGKGRPAARAYALAVFAYSFHWLLLLGGTPWMTRLGLAVFLTSGALFEPLAVRVALMFPERTAIRTWWARLLPWSFLAIGPGLSSWLLGVPFDGEAGLRILMATNLGFAATLLLIVGRSLRRADAVARRQIKWVILGLFLGLVPVLLAALAASFDTGLWWFYEGTLVATIAIPVCALIAIVRHDFLDVDRLLSAATSYMLLVALLGIPIVALIPDIAAPLAAATALDARYVQSGLVFLLIGVALSAESRMRPAVERFLFPSSLWLSEGTGAIRDELDATGSASDLLRLVCDRASSLLGSECCVLFVAVDGRFTAVYGHGGRSLPSFEEGAPLVRWIDSLREPSRVSPGRGFERSARLEPAEAAMLRDLDAAVMIPLRRGTVLEAFAALAWKRSGDVYTDSEIARLEAIAHHASIVVQRFDREAVDREERALLAEMLRYAPAKLRSEIRLGRGGESGERDVTILFVDMRGSTDLAERRAPDEVHRIVNHFTEEVSAIVASHGGSVVEFQGDALFCVFGAPDDLPRKEDQAVAAALAIVDRIEGADFARSVGEPVRVAAGVATGRDYAGSIDCADRRVWTVLGNTSNLAARLTSVAKDHGVSLVVDEATQSRCRDDRRATFSARPSVAIRGRSDLFTVYLVTSEEDRDRHR